MSDEAIQHAGGNGRRRKRRARSTRRLRFILLAVGLIGLVLGFGLVVLGWLRGVRRITQCGGLYILIFSGVLCVRWAVDRYEELRHRGGGSR